MGDDIRDYIHLSINGQLHKVRGKYAFLPLSDFLRYDLGATGTKVVCSEGDCGACTVMYRRSLSGNGKFQSLNSCISATILMDTCHLITVEGLEEAGQLSEIQDSMVRNFGGQCGYCTPGFVMSIANMYEQNSKPSEQNVKNYLTGNLCRCTGYTPIIEAALDVDTKKIKALKDQFNFSSISSELETDLNKPIKINWGNKEFFAPTTIEMAAKHKAQHPDVRIFSGATDLGVQINKGINIGQHFMSFHLIKDLYELSDDGEWINVGARVSLNDLQIYSEKKAGKFSEFLNIFASPQIKNTATLIGNIANGSPIADTTPYLLTADAEVDLYGANGKRSLPLISFIKGYKDFDLKPDEFITRIRFKILPEEKNIIGLYKVSQRRDLDISCVNSSFVFTMNNKTIESARISYGGVGPKSIRLTKLEDKISGQEINDSFISKTKKLIADHISPISDVRGTSEFRTLMCQELFEKYSREHLV